MRMGQRRKSLSLWNCFMKKKNSMARKKKKRCVWGARDFTEMKVRRLKELQASFAASTVMVRTAHPGSRLQAGANASLCPVEKPSTLVWLMRAPCCQLCSHRRHAHSHPARRALAITNLWSTEVQSGRTGISAYFDRSQTSELIIFLFFSSAWSMDN